MVEVPLSAGVVVDLDDTLYPERSFHESGFRWIASSLGLSPEGPEVRAASAELRSGGRPLDVLSDATGVPVPTLLAWHRDHRPEIELYPDAREFLLRMASSSIPVVLLTDGRRVTQEHKVDALGIRRLLDAVLISEATGYTKKDIEAYERAAAELPGREPLMYFGDNPLKDVQHPASLGWTVFLMRSRGDNVHPQDLAPRLERSVIWLPDFSTVAPAG